MNFDIKKYLKEARVLLLLIIIAFTVKSTLIEIYVVPTGSMENEILVGDLLIGNKFTLLSKYFTSVSFVNSFGSNPILVFLIFNKISDDLSLLFVFKV